MPQCLIITATSCKMFMVDNFTSKINNHFLVRVNHTRIKLKRLDTGIQNPKVGAIKFSQIWRIGLQRANKIIMDTTKNTVWGITIPLKRRFWTRQAMFRCQRFRDTTYTYTMIEGMKYASGNSVVQVYVTDFGGVIIYPLAHRIDSHTLLYQYFVGTGVREHIHSENAW